MADKEKYYIAIEGQLLEVNKEIYEVSRISSPYS